MVEQLVEQSVSVSGKKRCKSDLMNRGSKCSDGLHGTSSMCQCVKL